MKIQFVNFEHEPNLPDYRSIIPFFENVKFDSTVVQKDQEDWSSIDRSDVVVLNFAKLEFLKQIKKNESTIILITDSPIHQYAKEIENFKTLLIDHTISFNDNLIYKNALLRITLQKIIKKDVFGINKYLLPNTHTYKFIVDKSISREKNNLQVEEIGRFFQLGIYKSKLLAGIAEEFQMNAIIDAPLAAMSDEASPYHENQSHQAAPKASLKMGCDGEIFAISITDYYGAFKKDVFFKYIEKIYKKYLGNEIIDKKHSGAGLGLLKILFSANAIICNVSANKKTEIIALMFLNGQIKGLEKVNRTVQYFQA